MTENHLGRQLRCRGKNTELGHKMDVRGLFEFLRYMATFSGPGFSHVSSRTNTCLVGLLWTSSEKQVIKVLWAHAFKCKVLLC